MKTIIERVDGKIYIYTTTSMHHKICMGQYHAVTSKLK